MQNPRRVLATIGICFVLQGQALADEPKQGVAPNSGESGVTISLKLLPSNQKPDDEAKKEEATKEPPKESADPAKPESAKNPPKPSGSVELKLLPPKPPVDDTSKPKATDSKPESSGSVEMTLVPAKPKTAEGNSGTVIIDLTPVAKPDNKTSEKLPTTNPSAEKTNKEKGSSPKEVDESTVKVARRPASDAELKKRSSSRNRGGDPGDPGDEEGTPLPAQPDDIPLVEQAHPFDAPAAKATKEESRFSKGSNKGRRLSDSEVDRNEQITELLNYFRTHQENVVRRGPWALMHTILPYGVDTEIIAGKKKVNAIGWLCHNGISAKQRIFQPTKTGFRTNVGPGVQGHEGQFLAILAQSHVHPDYSIQVGNRNYTVNDLIKYEMATCREKTELTFKLIAFTHYLEPNQTWKDNRGRPWSIEKLVAEEIAQPINGEACGGTHRLMGLTCAVVSRQEAGLPLSGQFERAEKFLSDYVEYALSLQNPDGSFSTEWFERRADEQNVERKVQTTGHILEWLIYTLPDEHLKSPQIVKAVDFLLSTIGSNPGRDWPIGPRGHSLRALDLYQKRVFKGQDLSTDTNLAKPASKSLQR